MIVTLTGPSGVGKSTQAGLILVEIESARMVPSVSTRKTRETDQPGENVEVVLDEFQRRQAADEFAWAIMIHGNYYATEKVTLRAAAKSNDLWLMILTPDKVPTVHEYAPGRVVSIFLQSPGEGTLYNRLLEREESCSSATRRLQECRDWEARMRHLPIPVHFIPPGSIDETHRRVLQAIFSAKLP